MTFSVAGLCPRTGEMGCALATSSMAAGARAQFISADAGVVLSQARSDPRLGLLGLARLKQGSDAREALKAMIDASPYSAWRQLAVIDLNGQAVAFTGAECSEAKHELTAQGFVALGNGLASERVVDGMLAAVRASPERSLGERLIMGLEAGLEAGGEAHPLRSTALKVARPGLPLLPIDLRVDCSETPITELRRLWSLWLPMIDGYIQRCIDPANSASAALIEGYIS
jgi:uncharacterized Ntn-hydrolase superfamily protein